MLKLSLRKWTEIKRNNRNQRRNSRVKVVHITHRRLCNPDKGINTFPIYNLRVSAVKCDLYLVTQCVIVEKHRRWCTGDSNLRPLLFFFFNTLSDNSDIYFKADFLTAYSPSLHSRGFKSCIKRWVTVEASPDQGYCAINIGASTGWWFEAGSEGRAAFGAAVSMG